MALKRSANFDAEVEAEIARLCTEARCDVCLVPISSKEQKDKHYAGKIHAKKEAFRSCSSDAIDTCSNPALGHSQRIQE